MVKIQLSQVMSKAFKNIWRNKVLILLIFILSLPFLIAFLRIVLGPLALNLLANVVSLFMKQGVLTNLSSNDVLLLITMSILAMVYFMFIAVVLIKIFIEDEQSKKKALKMVFKYSISRLKDLSVTAVILFVMYVSVLIFLSFASKIIGILSLPVGFVLLFTIVVNVFFVFQSVVIDELEAMESIEQSIKYVKSHLGNVLTLIVGLSMMLMTLMNMITKLVSSISEVDSLMRLQIAVLPALYITYVFAVAFKTEYYAQSKIIQAINMKTTKTEEEIL